MIVKYLQLRNQSPDVFFKKGVPENFAEFTGKHLCQSLFFNKVASLRPAILLQKRLWHRRFLVIFVKFLRTPPFSIEHLWWLLLYIMGDQIAFFCLAQTKVFTSLTIHRTCFWTENLNQAQFN